MGPVRRGDNVMTGLSETVANLVSRARALAAVQPDDRLISVDGFGLNPGALQMRMHLPEALGPGAPLVVVLHGCGQTAAGYAHGAGWVELADRYGFALLCPEQTRSNNANACFNWFEGGDVARGGGEAASIAQMVRFALAEHRLDPRRVFVTGLSAGGAMTAVMLAAYPELFAAGAVVAGLPYGAANGVQQALAAMRQTPALSAHAWGDKVRAAAPTPPRWPRISIWHGEADTVVTPSAGEALARQWCDVHGVSQGVHELAEQAGHAHQSWRAADGGVAVELHRLAGLAHGTPIAAGGEDGYGAPAPWILEAGVSSSLQIARFWGVADASAARHRPRAAARQAPAPAPDASPFATTDVGETITRALRSAGLMR
jgi:poly(hydroxyalkanoate) depolymerase family esterase